MKLVGHYPRGTKCIGCSKITKSLYRSVRVWRYKARCEDCIKDLLK